MRHLSRKTICIVTLLLICAVSAIEGLRPATAVAHRKRLARPYVDVPGLRHGRHPDNSRVQNWLQSQQEFLNQILPGSPAPNPTPTPTPNPSKMSSNVDIRRENGPIIADVLPKTRTINTYSSLLRDFEPSFSHINDTSKKITILAPRNSAIHNLPHKPWENPEDYEQLGEVQAYEGREGKDRAQRNLKRFVDAHIVPTCPWKEGEEVEAMCGKKLKWVKEGDKMVVSGWLLWYMELC